MYNVLVLGSGGREHSMVWSLAQDKKVSKIFCAPGNAGTASIAKNLSVDLNNNQEYDISKRIGFMRNPKVHPDSKIFVSFKPEKDRTEGAFFERFTSIFGLLTGALTTVVLIKNIN